MCGFSILVNKGFDYNNTVIKDMTHLIEHRGPNNFGFSNERVENFDINFGHARLSIIDLQQTSNQPYYSKCKKVSLVFNGEIYNFNELRQDLISKGVCFNTHSDTEVLLEAYLYWDEECLNKFNGMFSFAILDQRKKLLLVARDRFGVKPLYFSQINKEEIVFSSEIKQIFCHPKVNKTINTEVSFRYLFQKSHKYGNETFFNNIYELESGSLMKICLKSHDINPKKETWYNPNIATQDINIKEASQKFYSLFVDSIKLRLNADVPVGTGLSGGLDSSSIVCQIHDLLKNNEWNHPLKTFSARFINHKLDEGEYIQSVVDQSKSDHKETYPNAGGLFDSINKFSWHHDEPVLSSAVYAQWCTYKLVSNSGVKVTLDGHGADEILGGYKSFFRPLLLDHLKSLRFLRFFSETKNLQKMYNYSYKTPYLWMLSSIFGSDVSLVFKNFTGNNKLNYKWFKKLHKVSDTREPSEINNLNRKNFQDFSKEMLYTFSMPPQLQWADRNSMAFSVESRAPFLDYRLVEFCLSLSSEFKLNNGINKLILRNAIGYKLPSKVIDRKYKQGFESPERAWLLDKKLHNEIASILLNARVINSDILSEECFDYCDKILNKECNYDEFLWRIISFSKWREVYKI